MSETVEKPHTIIMVGEPRGFVWAQDPAVVVVPTMADAIAHLAKVLR